MEIKALQLQKTLSYKELVKYLLGKYGPAKYDYFELPLLDIINPKVLRIEEGLLCHHIDSDKAVNLSSPEHAQKNPIEYQRKDRLVYCNLLEYLLLHIKIILEQPHPDANPNEKIGISGLEKITSIINDYYNGYLFEEEHLNIATKLISANFKDYINILREFIRTVRSKVDNGRSRLQYARWLSRSENNPNKTNIVFEELSIPDEDEMIPPGELKKFEEQARLGDAEAQIKLGDLYRVGNNIKQNKQLSFYYMSKAADQGSAYAIIMMGKFFEIGFGITADVHAAFRYFMMAAEAEIDQGMYEVGISYLEGKGVRQNKEEAINWLTKAADKGYEKAKEVLENYYNNMN